MNKENTRAKTAGKMNNAARVPERESNRWLVMIYDSIVYLLCWMIVFVLHISATAAVKATASTFYLVLGYVLIFGLRFAFRVYKQIWRYGTITAFWREVAADLLGSGLYLMLGRLASQQFEALRVSFISLLSFAAIYVAASILIRIFYSYLYSCGLKKTKLGQTIRKILKVAALVDFDSDEPGAVMHLALEPANHGASPINEVQNIAEQFSIVGRIIQITQIKKGYINRTYKVQTLSENGHLHNYTLQRINTDVFPDVDALMHNFMLTTQHLKDSNIFELPGKNIRGSVQEVRTTKDGKAYLKHQSGCWRMLTHFDGVYSLDIPDRPETFYHAGLAFGKFVRAMSDVDAKNIREVIPNFHNTKSRYENLEKSIEKDPKGRVAEVAKEIAFVRARGAKYGLISEALEKGEIPTRICHNDCNLNNILFDNDTHLPVVIIDLDTVMPSSPLYDYGDSMRIGTNTAKDDEKDLSKVSCNLDLYERYARGYLKSCGDMLTKRELELLPYASLIITSEDGIRFLMDHIDGDTYYNIYYPGQNLDRSRTQLKLVEDMERKLPEIKAILQKIYAELGLEADLSKDEWGA